MAQVSVTIADKIYRMACDDGQEEHLQALGRELDDTINGLRKSVGEIGDQRLTVMAAITLADSRAELRREIDALKAEIEGLRSAMEAEVARQDDAEAGVAQAIETAAAQIEAAARKLIGQ
jgi:cell division protein ZapA